MSQKISPYLIFLPLGFAFLVFGGTQDELLITCSFYAFFVGAIWTLIPQVIGEKGLSWKHTVPPLFLLLIMMLSAKLRTSMNSEVVTITAMGLLHFRASVLSFAILKQKGKIFTFLQFFTFIFVLLYLFQKNLFSFEITRTHFLSSIMLMGVVSAFVLWKLKKKYEPTAGPSNHP